MPLVVRLNPELEQGLNELSEEENTPKAEILRERLAQRRKRPNAYAIAQELGVIGADTDPRTDVAQHHYRYLRAALRGKIGVSIYYRANYSDLRLRRCASPSGDSPGECNSAACERGANSTFCFGV